MNDREKVLLPANPSFTVTVIVAEPYAFGSGVMVSVPWVSGLV